MLEVNIEQVTGRKLKASGSHPRAPGHNIPNASGAGMEVVEPEGAKQVGDLQLQQAQAVEPPPWWQHALQQIQANTQEIVGQALLKVNAEVCELREEVRDLRQQAASFKRILEFSSFCGSGASSATLQEA